MSEYRCRQAQLTTRAAEDDWDDGERLFVRLPPIDQCSEGDVPFRDQMRFASVSCNRERHSAPEDVLVFYDPHRPVVMCWSRNHLPPAMTSPGSDSKTGTDYFFDTAHDPAVVTVEDVETGDAWRVEVYAHSELRLNREGVPYSPKHKPSSRKFQIELQEAMAQALQPVELTNPPAAWPLPPPPPCTRSCSPLS